MSSYDLPLQDVLTAIELREAELLSWGAVSAQWSEDELLSLLNQFGDPEIILGKLKQSALVVETPSGHFRTRAPRLSVSWPPSNRRFPANVCQAGRHWSLTTVTSTDLDDALGAMCRLVI